jgi:crotonobetainyl-CoA:carnitine CoA-transferase CaiB-like acyl-CoA transferase
MARGDAAADPADPATDPLPLAGLRVLDFGHTVMGPSCGVVLADLGAEVIRIEPPEGDRTRRLRGFGIGFFAAFNRNKKSLAIDLKHPEGHALVERLIGTADALLENFAPGTMERLGLGWERVHALNPRLVFCSLKGYLPGPYEEFLALDEVVQMQGGLAYMTGAPGKPMRAGASVVDIMGGAFGVIGILAALRERDRTGRGQRVQSALFESVAFLVAQHMAASAISGVPVPPMSARRITWAIYDVFDTADGQVFVAATSDQHWRRLCDDFPDALGGLRDDPALATNEDRVRGRDRFMPILRALFAPMRVAEVVERMRAARLPSAPVARPDDLFADPHLLTTGAIAQTRLTESVRAALPLTPLHLERGQMTVRREPPRIGEDTEAVLAGLGLGAAEIADLAARGVVALGQAEADRRDAPVEEGDASAGGA